MNEKKALRVLVVFEFEGIEDPDSNEADAIVESLVHKCDRFRAEAGAHSAWVEEMYGADKEEDEVSEVERLRKENKWRKDEHALLSRDEAALSLKCRWLREENERLREALKKIRHEVTNDIGGLPRDEALNIITWVAETADAALRQEV